MEKKKVNVLAIILFILLLCSLCYIGYFKLGAKEKCKKNDKKETEVVDNCIHGAVGDTLFNKDGYFIKDLMAKIYLRTTSGDEEQLYTKDVVTIKDLSENYVNYLVMYRLGGFNNFNAFSKDDFEEKSVEMFGEKLNRSEKLDSLCGLSYKLTGDQYVRVDLDGGCGGAGIRYFDRITKVERDSSHIYVYQKKGFQCSESVCKEPLKIEYGYSGTDPIREFSLQEDEEKIMDEILDKLHEYKFTFTYDKTNNTYYFEKVERVS